MTRTDAVIRAVTAQLNARRAAIDGATDLRAVILDVKLSPNALEPRTVVARLEHEGEAPRRRVDT